MRINTYRIWRLHADGTTTHVCDRLGESAHAALEGRFNDRDLAPLTGKIAVAHIDSGFGTGGFAIFEVVDEPTLRRVAI